MKINCADNLSPVELGIAIPLVTGQPHHTHPVTLATPQDKKPSKSLELFGRKESRSFRLGNV